MTDFQIGDVVECIDAKPRPQTPEPLMLRMLDEGATYTVSGRCHGGVWLAEVPSGWHGYFADRFRHRRNAGSRISAVGDALRQSFRDFVKYGGE